jgi:hypothetical protein
VVRADKLRAFGTLGCSLDNQNLALTPRSAATPLLCDRPCSVYQQLVARGANSYAEFFLTSLATHSVVALAVLCATAPDSSSFKLTTTLLSAHPLLSDDPF